MFRNYFRTERITEPDRIEETGKDKRLLQHTENGGFLCRGCCKIRIPVDFRCVFRRKHVRFQRKITRKGTTGDILQHPL